MDRDKIVMRLLVSLAERYDVFYRKYKSKIDVAFLISVVQIVPCGLIWFWLFDRAWFSAIVEAHWWIGIFPILLLVAGHVVYFAVAGIGLLLKLLKKFALSHLK